MRILAPFIVVPLLAACAGEEVLQPNVNVSVGQQLIELKQAKDSGAISASEYEAQKRRLIRSVR